MADRFAVLLDGGFVKKKLKERTRQDFKAADIVSLTYEITQRWNFSRISRSATVA
jgi:hypothetical protein